MILDGFFDRREHGRDFPADNPDIRDSATAPCRAGESVVGTGVQIFIRTLGRFSLSIGTLPVRAEGKGKQRPLTLLKALVAFGGCDLCASKLWDCLWPDSDGDIGARNLAVTLHRLRDLLGSSAAVLMHDGKLTLNDRICWVDVWCFEQWADEGVARLRASYDDADGLLFLQRAFDLYRGHFLACETEQHWMLAPRLRLKSTFERLASALAERLEKRHHFGDAADVCLRGIERDPLNELLYRRLMRCYLQMGEYSCVLRTYRRCLEALSKGLAVQPSAATQQVYLDAVRADARSASVDGPFAAAVPPLMARARKQGVASDAKE